MFFYLFSTQEKFEENQHDIIRERFTSENFWTKYKNSLKKRIYHKLSVFSLLEKYLVPNRENIWLFKIKNKYAQKTVQIFSRNSFENFRPFVQNLFFRKTTIFLMRNGKILIFNERKMRSKYSSKIHRNSRKFSTKMNEFRSFFFANFVQRKFRWKP